MRFSGLGGDNARDEAGRPVRRNGGGATGTGVSTHDARSRRGRVWTGLSALIEERQRTRMAMDRARERKGR